MARSAVLSYSTFVLSALALAGGASAFGPDVIVGEIPSLANWTSGGAVGGIRAYSAGTTSCNIGDVDALWVSSTNQHPVIGQELYRLKDGRFEQLGYSWLKHSFLALTGQTCPPPPACNGHGGSVLGIGCSDPYTASRNGSYGTMGPRYQVNVTTGVYAYPFDASAPSGSPIGKRIQVQESDIDPALNPGALYFVSAEYTTGDDALAGNGRNNMSYKAVIIGAMPALNISVSGVIQRTMPGIQAWKDTDASVTLHSVEYTEPSGLLARYWIAAKATNLGGGMFHYEYAVQNINSDRAAASFSVPKGPGVIVTNVGFHDVNPHSGDGAGAVNPSGVDWTPTVTPTAVTWASETFAQNPTANSLRWARMYNFRFDANSPPTTGTLTVGLYKPGSPTSVSDNNVVPTPGPAAPQDLNGDGHVNSRDLGILLVSWTLPPATACSGAACAADFNGDGVVDSSDLGSLLGAWTG